MENTEKTLLGWVNLFSIQKGKENYIDLTEIHIRGEETAIMLQWFLIYRL